MLEFMLIAGEASGDELAAELVRGLKASPELTALPFESKFFGAGGPEMAAAGVEIVLDLPSHAIFGVTDVFRHLLKFRQFFNYLLRVVSERQPDVIILVDYSGFNRRFAHAIKQRVRSRRGPFQNWNPRIVYYVSPQVWASREGRAYQLARDVDLMLSIFPFEKEWYAARTPNLNVEFVGHPLIDRYARSGFAPSTTDLDETPGRIPLVLLLPGSRKRELEAHLPVLVEAVHKIRSAREVRVRLILPNERLREQAAALVGSISDLEVRIGGLAESLAETDVALASSGTVTMECAYFRVPTVVLYKTSPLTYQIARRIVKVQFIAMPNLLANELIYPEFIQDQATSDNITREALEFLNNAARRSVTKARLAKVIDSLGALGASRRAASAIMRLLRGAD